MTDQIQENSYIFDDTSLVRESALIEAKKKSDEAKGFLHSLVKKGKEDLKKAISPETIANKIKAKAIKGLKHVAKPLGRVHDRRKK